MLKSKLFAREDTSRDPLTEQVIGAAIEVHRILGPGLLESTYRDCMACEVRERGLAVARDVPLARGIKRGLLLNFHVPLLKDGIKRIIY